jgi:dTDP-4-dehydrorhamnose 3,5-epimerase
LEIKETSLPGVLLITPKLNRDPRGYLFESYRADRLAEAGVPSFVQENQSSSVAGTLRGLHFQLARPQGKLVRVLSGSIYDVAVDIRRGSTTFGRWHAEVLSAENQRQLYIPPDFAHGFCVLEERAEVLYKCTDYYSGPDDQKGIIWNDRSIGITWPVADPLISAKDRALLALLAERNDLPVSR